MENKIDKDYILYLKEEGKTQEALWLYLDHILNCLEEIKEQLGGEEKENKLMGMFKIQPQSTKGLHKGPPPSVIS